MQLARVVVGWSGPSVKGLAVNVLHVAADSPFTSVAGIKTAYQQIASQLPSGVSIGIPGTGDVIEDTTGELVGTWTATGAGIVSGAAAAPAAAGVGACVTWLTGGIVNGRRLRGRTFLVPLSAAAFDSDGTLIAGAYAAVNSFASGMMGAGPVAVWHRPTTVGGSDGNSYGLVAYKTSDKVAFLSSRRD